MPERNAENNRVSVIGVVVSGFEFSHDGLWGELLHNGAVSKSLKRSV